LHGVHRRKINVSTYERLVGTWRMLSLRIEMQDTGELIEPWGARPTAWLILTPEGRLMTVCTASDRSPPTTEAEAAAQLNKMVCYSGMTRMEGENRFVTDVDAAWSPSWLGTQQARTFTVEGNKLSVRSDVGSHPGYPGRKLSFILSWEREA
jgi:hypothetical protein